ncbi:MAG: SprT-like domain-containing protein [Oscillospiraceae bacterium]|nr:SprT-like domain-containing protein [Oscillospiraceae bacterium]
MNKTVSLPNAGQSAEPPVQPDLLLARVIAQARALGIPVSARIDPHVRINTRAKKRFGCCIGTVSRGFTIELAAALLPAGERSCMQTLAHEILHTCPGCQDHGEKWKAYAARMNAACGYDIRRTDRPEALGVELPPAAAPVFRWRITCARCGKSFFRQKSSPLTKNPQRYRCAACGGALRVEKLC